MTRTTHIVAVFVTAVAAGCTAPSGGLAPDTIWVNGTVITMEGERVVQAVAVLGDLIVAVGSDAEVQALGGPETRVVDLDGRTMTPGFYAAHDHFPGSGRVAVTRVDLNSPPIGAIENMDQLVAALRARAEELPEGQWVSGRGYDDTLLAEQRHPTRADLDRASTTHPIYISHTSGHLGVASSLALELAGIIRDTPDPPGRVVRKHPDTGEPDGVFEESGGMVSRLIPSPTPEQTMEAYRWAVEDYVEDGVTTAVIAGGGRGSLAGLQRARDAGILTFRIITMMSRGAPGQPSAAEAGGRDQRPAVVDRPRHPVHRARRHTGHAGQPAAAGLDRGEPADTDRPGAGSGRTDHAARGAAYRDDRRRLAELRRGHQGLDRARQAGRLRRTGRESPDGRPDRHPRHPGARDDRGWGDRV